MRRFPTKACNLGRFAVPGTAFAYADRIRASALAKVLFEEEEALIKPGVEDVGKLTDFCDKVTC